MGPGSSDVRSAPGRSAPLLRSPAQAGLAAVLLFLPSLSMFGFVDEARAQDTGWTGRLLFRGFSVRDAESWLRVRQGASRVFAEGSRIRVGLSQTRRFGVWDVSAGAGGTLRPADRVYLSLDGRVTPVADVLEDARLEARGSLQLGRLVPSLGYRLQIFGEGTVHTVSPRLVWYGGPWRLSGEARVIRSAVETVNVAVIGRATRRLSPDWTAWLGLASGEEDFRVGRPPDRRLRTLSTRAASGGVEHDLDGVWSVRLSVTGVESDPRLDRIGGTLVLSRTF